MALFDEDLSTTVITSQVFSEGPRPVSLANFLLSLSDTGKKEVVEIVCLLVF